MRAISPQVEEALVAAVHRRPGFLRACFERGFLAFHSLLKVYAVGEYRHRPTKSKAIALYWEFFAGSVAVDQGLKGVRMFRAKGEISDQLHSAIAKLEAEQQKAKSMNVVMRKLTSHSRVPAVQLFDNYFFVVMSDGTDRGILLEPLESVFARERRTDHLVHTDLSLLRIRNLQPFRDSVAALREGGFDLPRLGLDKGLLEEIGG